MMRACDCYRFSPTEGLSTVTTILSTPISYFFIQLFLHLNGIEHSRTKTRHPQTNGCTEKLNQIIQDEFYAAAFRKKVYTSVEEIQTDLDQFMWKYNNERTNQGKYCQGRTPMETWRAEYDLYKRHVIDETEALPNCPAIWKDGPSPEESALPPSSLEDRGPVAPFTYFQSQRKEMTTSV